MSARVNEFARRVYVAARNIGLAEPQARLAAAQASVETGYGKSVKGNNYFGIKAGKSWSGSVQNFRTWEEVNGQKVNVSDKFRKYENLEESLKDWVGTVTRRWPDAMIATTFEDAMRGLRYGRPDGYATDSHYGEKLAYVERRIGESYSPPTDELKNFLRKTEADADLSNLLAGERGVPQQATISDTQGVVDVNILATPVPRHKPGTMPLQAASWDEGERRSDMNLVSVPAPQAKPSDSLDFRDRVSEYRNNPFSLANTNLEQQVELLERNPLWAKQMILAAGRDPRFFGL